MPSVSTGSAITAPGTESRRSRTELPASGLRLASRDCPARRPSVVGLCALFAVARMAISWFPMDVPGTQRTETGRRHGLLAICAFGAVAVAAEQLAKLLTRDHLHPHLGNASTVLAILMLVTFVGMGVVRRAGGEYFGLVERGFYAFMTGWLVLVAILLSRPA